LCKKSSDLQFSTSKNLGTFKNLEAPTFNLQKNTSKRQLHLPPAIIPASAGTATATLRALQGPPVPPERPGVGSRWARRARGDPLERPPWRRIHDFCRKSMGFWWFWSPLVGGWPTLPPWNIWVLQIGSSSLLGKIKNVPNHQPVSRNLWN
jgi:hypothetical protein